MRIWRASSKSIRIIQMEGKPAGVFTSTASTHGGQETTLLTDQLASGTSGRLQGGRVMYRDLVAYMPVPDENPLWVLAALHGRRSPHVLSAILKSRQ
jgi:hypothetical protein